MDSPHAEAQQLLLPSMNRASDLQFFPHTLLNVLGGRVSPNPPRVQDRLQLVRHTQT